MAVIALTSFSGAPGVTTLAIAWAYLNRRPTLIVEADPTGGSPILAGPFRGEVTHDTSVLLLAEREREEMAEFMWHYALDLPETSDRKVLPAVSTHIQARTLIGVWPTLAQALIDFSHRAGVDVVIDMGRMALEDSPRPLAAAADAILVLVPASLPAINTAVWGLPELRDEAGLTGPAERVGIVPVRPEPALTRRLHRRVVPGTAARPYTDGEIGQITDPTPVLTPLVWNPDAAQVYSHATLAPKDFQTSRYSRSVEALIDSSTAHIRSYRLAAGLPDLESHT